MEAKVWPDRSELYADRATLLFSARKSCGPIDIELGICRSGYTLDQSIISFFEAWKNCGPIDYTLSVCSLASWFILLAFDSNEKIRKYYGSKIKVLDSIVKLTFLTKINNKVHIQIISVAFLLSFLLSKKSLNCHIWTKTHLRLVFANNIILNQVRYPVISIRKCLEWFHLEIVDRLLLISVIQYPSSSTKTPMPNPLNFKKR